MFSNLDDYIEKVCMSDDLSSYDPYDIWKTRIGLVVKHAFNKNRFIGGVPAMILALTDQIFNNKLRLGYKKQEYAIVRAVAALILLHKYESSHNPAFLSATKRHLEWLNNNASIGYSGACWGLGFMWPAAANVIYDANTPHATHTPYALEAFHNYTKLSGDDKFIGTIKSCFQFYENDLQIMYEDQSMMATSYGPLKDRIATNAVSYVMYSYAIFLSYFPLQHKYIHDKIQKLYQFIRNKQQSNGSWLYTPDDPNSFIDCFHSCLIAKNILKTNSILELPDSAEIIKRAYNYLCTNFYEKKSGLYKRFSKANKLSLTNFDLYDNAEMLNLTNMLGDTKRVISLDAAIRNHFIKQNDIYSVIDLLNIRRNKNTLRWAVMPYLYALTTLTN